MCLPKPPAVPAPPPPPPPPSAAPLAVRRRKTPGKANTRITNQKKARKPSGANALRIDLNVPQSGGNGLNVPVGQ